MKTHVPEVWFEKGKMPRFMVKLADTCARGEEEKGPLMKIFVGISTYSNTVRIIWPCEEIFNSLTL